MAKSESDNICSDSSDPTKEITESLQKQQGLSEEMNPDKEEKATGITSARRRWRMRSAQGWSDTSNDTESGSEEETHTFSFAVKFLEEDICEELHTEEDWGEVK